MPAPQPTGADYTISESADGSYLDLDSHNNAIMLHNKFAVDMYQQLAQDPALKGKNIFFSPFSMYMAFSFLYEGARGETASQMERVFGFYSDANTRHEYVSQVIASINRNDSHATLETANALWLNKEFKPYETYTDIVRDIYLADIESLDFNDGGASAKRINDWAAHKTRDKITEVVTPDIFNDDTMAILNNAIYFKGTWVNQFDPDATREDAFWMDRNIEEKADFMHNQAFFDYAQLDGVQILRLPYEGDRLSMLVILPSEVGCISQLENDLSADHIHMWQQQMHNTEVQTSIPKFKASTNYFLNDYLVNLGIPDTFSPSGANFMGIANITTLGGNLYVSKATQDAFVDVNEEGTEAAAVTTIFMLKESFTPMPPMFTADHPFVFAIQDDESGALLFMGRFSNPNT